MLKIIKTTKEKCQAAVAEEDFELASITPEWCFVSKETKIGDCFREFTKFLAQQCAENLFDVKEAEAIIRATSIVVDTIAETSQFGDITAFAGDYPINNEDNEYILCFLLVGKIIDRSEAHGLN